VLATAEGVFECAVTTAQDVAGNLALVAHVAGTADPHAVRAYLAHRLPTAMQPAAIAVQASLPHTVGGKIDRRALQADGLCAIRKCAAASLAPRDETERRLQRLWAEVLHAPDIGVRDNFFDAGGHSLLAVRLMAQIEHEFGRALPLSSLLQSPPTIEYQAGQLREPVRRDVSILVAAAKPPFFCMHPVAGAVMIYRDLIRCMDPHRPLRCLSVAAPPESSIETMAAECVKTLRQAQPSGPYHLGGWSTGGVMAFEMACQLAGRGERVAALVLIDSFLPGDVTLPIDAEEALLRARAPDDHAGISAMFAAVRAFERLLQSYVPRRYDGSVLLIRAGEPLSRTASPSWADIAPALVTQTAPGNHYSMMREPNVGAWTGKLLEFLDRGAA
jgi:thioesterase domain-containing protein/acyl carrier protein